MSSILCDQIHEPVVWFNLFWLDILREIGFFVAIHQLCDQYSSRCGKYKGKYASQDQPDARNDPIQMNA